MADSLGKLFVDLILRDDGFQKNLTKATKDVSAFGKEMEGLTSTIAGKFTSALWAASAAVSGFLAGSALIGASFEHQINRVAVLADAAVEPLAVAARRFGKETSFSAQDAAGAMESLAQAGFKTADIIGGTAAALALAAASGSQLADATKIVAVTMSQFQLNAADSARISDVFTAALNTSQLNMSDLTLAMSYAGTVGASFGMTLEETTAAVAMFSNLGLEGSKAGTAFRMSMSMAANVTRVAEDVLKKYGLTAKDINPELYSFGEIIQTVGEHGITASDAMKVFGTEVGGNVAALAQQAMDSGTRVETTFDGITSTLMNSAGVAEETANKMKNTVAGAFQILRGSAEEVMLAVFDTYAEPLKRLLLELVDFANDLGSAFQRNAVNMEQGFGGALDSITAWLAENRNVLITTIVSFVQGVADVAAELAKLIPYLDEIAVLMGVVWVVNAVASFAVALGDAWIAVGALQAALAALGVEITAMSGGLYLAVAAFGAVLAALAAYVLATGEATAAAERLTDAQTKQAALNDSRFQAQIAHLQELLLAQQAQAQAEIASGQELSRVRRAELQQLLALDAEQAALLVRQGKLVEVGGELRTAASLVAEAMDTASAEKLGSAYKALRTNQMDARKEALALAAQLGMSQQAVSRATGLSANDLAKLGYAASGIREQFESGAISAETYGSAIARATGATDIATMEDAQIKFEALSAEIAALDRAAVKFRGDSALAQRAMVDEAERATGATRDRTRAVEDFSRTARATEKKQVNVDVRAREAAVENNAQQLTTLQQQLEDALATESERKDLARRREEAAIAASYQKQVELGGLTATQLQEVQAQMHTAQGLARARWAAEDAAAAQAAVQAAAAAEADAEAALAAQVEELRRGSMATSVRLDAERVDALRALDENLASELKNIEGLSAEQRAALQLQFAQASAAGRLAIERDFQKKIEDAHSAERTAALAAPTKLAVWWKKQLKTIEESIPLSFERGLRTAGNAITAFVTNAEKAFKAIGGFIGGVWNSLTGLVERLTGFKFSISDLISSLQDGAGATDGTGFDAAAAATAFVEELFTKAADFATLLVQAVPPALKALAAGIPDLIQRVVEMLPVLIDSIVALLPRLISGVIDQLPSLIGAIIDGVVTLVSELADMLPALTKRVTAMIPGFITAILSAIPLIIKAIIGSIPDVLQAIINGLPAILLAIVNGIPGIIMAIVNAIPKIIVSILLAIPQIVGAVVGMLPELITMIISLIPKIIVSLARSLPDLIPALSNLIPMLVIEIIKALPAIVVALVKGIVVELIMKLPMIVVELLKGLWEGIKAMVSALVDAFKDLFTSSKRKNKEEGAYSGIEYVPAPMRVKLHPGEAVIPADRNARRLHGAYPAPAGAAQQAWNGGGGGGGGPIEISIVAEGRVLEEVQLRAQEMGRATGLMRGVRRAAGVTVGFSRGSYTPWSK